MFWQNFRLKKICITFIIVVLFSCNNTNSKSSRSKTLPLKSVGKTSNSTPKLKLVNDSITVLCDGKEILVPQDSSIIVDMAYDGIAEVKNDTLKKTSNFLINDILYFTTYNDVGTGRRGYLHAFDLKSKKKYISDPTFKRNYLYSSGGLFFLKHKKIYVLLKPAFNAKKNFLYTAVSSYRIETQHFEYLTTIYSEGEYRPDDSSFVDFYIDLFKETRSSQPVLPKIGSKNGWLF